MNRLAKLLKKSLTSIFSNFVTFSIWHKFKILYLGAKKCISVWKWIQYTGGQAYKKLLSVQKAIDEKLALVRFIYGIQTRTRVRLQKPIKNRDAI